MADAKELGDSQSAVLSINPKDKAGNPASVQSGSVVWAVSDTTLATLEPVLDDAGAVVEGKQRIRSTGTLGVVTATVDADADLGEGVEDVQDSIIITIVSGPAKNLGLSMDVPEDNP